MPAYNRDAAILYAKQWALSRNPLYVDFSKLGGDCANFVSQCLHAGGCEMNFTPVSGWYYQNGYKRTASWTGVEFLYQFLITNMREGPHARLVSMESAEPADIVQLGNAAGAFYHAMLIVSAGSELRVAAHTEDVWMRPLSDYTYAQIRFLHIVS